MKRAIITSKNVFSLGAIDGQVTAKAWFETNTGVNLKAWNSVALDPEHGMEDGSVGSDQVTEIKAAAQLAIEGAVTKLQAIVDAWAGPFEEEGTATYDPKEPLVLDVQAFLVA